MAKEYEKSAERKKCRRAVANVVVRPCLGEASTHWQSRLRAIQGLNLTLLINAQNQRFIRWIHVQADYVAQLLDEVWIPAQFECLHSVRP